MGHQTRRPTGLSDVVPRTTDATNCRRIFRLRSGISRFTRMLHTTCAAAVTTIHSFRAGTRSSTTSFCTGLMWLTKRTRSVSRSCPTTQLRIPMVLSTPGTRDGLGMGRRFLVGQVSTSWTQQVSYALIPHEGLWDQAQISGETATWHEPLVAQLVRGSSVARASDHWSASAAPASRCRLC